jgi:hypothetical protein
MFIFGHRFPTSGQAGSQAESSFHQHLLNVLVALLGNGIRIALSAELKLKPLGSAMARSRRQQHSGRWRS